MQDIILASASPRRRELLKQIGIPFRVLSADVDEDTGSLKGSPGEKAESIALLKARHVAGKLKDGLVLGADTMVVLDDRIFGKPADRDEAYAMLSELSGKEHLVITGVAIVDAANGHTMTSHEVTRVKFLELSPDKIQAYIDRTHCYDKAGAYGIQDMGVLLVEKIDGCYSNVVGLPLVLTATLLERFGVKVL